MSSDSELDSPRTSDSTPRSTPDLCTEQADDCYDELKNLHSFACINVKDICRPLSPILDSAHSPAPSPVVISKPERRRPPRARKPRSPNQKWSMFSPVFGAMPPPPMFGQPMDLSADNKRKIDAEFAPTKYAKLYPDFFNPQSLIGVPHEASVAGDKPLDLRINAKR